MAFPSRIALNCVQRVVEDAAASPEGVLCYSACCMCVVVCLLVLSRCMLYQYVCLIMSLYVYVPMYTYLFLYDVSYFRMNLWMMYDVFLCLCFVFMHHVNLSCL